MTGGLIGGGLKVDDIDRYWPLGLQEKARDWVVAQVHGGRVDGLSVAIDIRPGMLGEEGRLARQAVQGEFAFTGIAVDYQPPLPPVRNLTGTGSFDLRGMRYLLDPGGKAGETGLALGRARVAIEGFGVKGVPTRVTVAVPVTGPVGDVLDVLALPPIEFVDPAFSDPEGLEGQAAIDLSLDLPIGVDSPEVIYSARGRIDKLAVQAAVLGLDVEQGAFAVAVDNRLARLNGKAVVGARRLISTGGRRLIQRPPGNDGSMSAAGSMMRCGRAWGWIWPFPDRAGGAGSGGGIAAWPARRTAHRRRCRSHARGHGGPRSWLAQTRGQCRPPDRHGSSPCGAGWRRRGDRHQGCPRRCRRSGGDRRRSACRRPVGESRAGPGRYRPQPIAGRLSERRQRSGPDHDPWPDA
ncbi:DUF3971 domain-containing protein [Tistrella bauzanensis]